jgi:hypothetical protein
VTLTLHLVPILALAGRPLRAVGLLRVLKISLVAPGAGTVRVRTLVPVLALVNVHSVVTPLVLGADTLVAILRRRRRRAREGGQSRGGSDDEGECNAHDGDE